MFTSARTVARAALLAPVLAMGASAAEVQVFSTIGLQSSLQELTPKLEAATGDKLHFTWGTAALLVKQVQAGESADLLLLSRQGLDTLTQSGKATADPQPDIASSVIAAVVKKGARKPDISTPAAFRQALLQARSIAISDPAAGGASGVYLTQLLQRMGLADQLKSKIKYPLPGGNSALLVANGEAELALQQQPEVMAQPGVDLVGPLPAELNSVTMFSAGIGVASQQKKAAAELIRLLHGAQAAAVFKAKGLTPANAR
jgi:molybdate transport system substrate-binding protein